MPMAANEPAFNQVVNSYGILSGTTIDQSQGALQKTGNELDLAIDGPGYFVVQTANGPLYTRNGAFQVSSNGQLVTQSATVMGDKGPITIPARPGHDQRRRNDLFKRRGFRQAESRGVSAGNGTDQRGQHLLFRACEQRDSIAKNSSVRQGMLESSNVNPIFGMVELVTAQRSAEMMQRALDDVQLGDG